MNVDLSSFNSLFIASIVTSLYNDKLSSSWSFDRYFDFLDFSNTVMLTTQNSSTYIIVYSLKIVETYLKQFPVEPIESEMVIFLTAFKLSQKYLDDFHYSSWEIDLSLLTELNSTQLKQFEWRFLDIINYEITMTPTDYAKWETNCQDMFMSFVVPITPFEPMKCADVEQDAMIRHGLLSPPYSAIPSDYWVWSKDEDNFFKDITFC